MVDFQSRYRIYSYGYVAPTSRPGIPTTRQLKHEANRLLAGSHGDRPVHDCRLESMKEYIDPKDWETQILFHGIKQTYDELKHLHSKPAVPAPCPKREPDKLLLTVGIKGSGNGDFCYPRDLITTDDCDVIVADTKNHRIQVINQLGIFRYKFGKKGSADGEFNEPTGISQLPNNHLVVADSKNKRIQIFTPKGVFKSSFTTKRQPYSVATDSFKNIIIATLSGTIEIYDRDFKLVREFPLIRRKEKYCFVKLCIDGDEQVYVCDSVQGIIQLYSYTGKLVKKFEPASPDDALAVVPSDICFDHIGQLVVSDTLNHTINVYTMKGEFIRQVMRPTDEIGAVFAVSIGPEGHLVTSEFSLTGEHCVKMFRYSPCDCHANRPPSSKRRTPRFSFSTAV